MSNLSSVHFNKSNSEFYKSLIKKVNHYFKENGISRYGNWKMVIKTIFMFLLYFTPYFFILSGFIQSTWIVLGMYALMGAGAAGIGLSVMHDANHGSYSRNKKINKLMSWSMNLLGGGRMNWKIQHNVLHHSFTNIHGLDEDIDPKGILRFSPHAKYHRFHRFQFIYSWFFYSLMTLSWILAKDYSQLVKYQKLGLLKVQKTNLKKEMTILIITKLVYLSYTVLIPILLASISWPLAIGGFIVMHLVTGFSLAIIFQPAHVVPNTEFPVSDEAGNMKNNWAIHQLFTTTNFAEKSRVFSWFVGGLNFQIEHHLFPNVCHIHYKKISKIVKKTAEEFKLPYYSQPTFIHALWAHGKMLWQLGQPQRVAVMN